MSLSRTTTLFAVLAALVVGSAVSATPATVSAISAPAVAASSEDDAQIAAQALAELRGRYRLLEGVTVRIGSTPAGHQAVAYPSRGEIVISPDRTADIATILAHEVWHIIDWRDDGRIDWGESLPPAGAGAFLR